MKEGRSWENAGREPPVAELLSDPITQMLMRADAVMVEDVIAAIDGRNRRHGPSRLERRKRPDAAAAQRRRDAHEMDAPTHAVSPFTE
jgi:hypothetical protein